MIINPLIILIVFALSIYAIFGMLFNFRWVYYLGILTGYMTGIVASCVGFGIVFF